MCRAILKLKTSNMKTIEGNLILKKDTTFNEDLKVKGNIKGNFNLEVIGNIHCLNIDCLNIDCWNIHCRDINCWNIDCRNIIYCNKIKAQKEIKAKKLIKNRFKLKQKIWK